MFRKFGIKVYLFTEHMADSYKNISRYLTVWKHFTINSFSIAFVSRFGAIIFLIAKFFRFIFFLGFLVLILGSTKNLGNFNLYQITLFFLTFNLIDTLTQLLYREVYRFRFMVVEGTFDYVLLKPINSLFRVLFGGADILDVFMLIPIVLAIIYVSLKMPPVTLFNLVIYLLLIINSLVLTTAFHIIVAAIGILTTTVDHTIMIYRDITSTGRIPVDIYREPVRGLLTFIIPVGIIMTFPVKALMGLLSFQGILISFLLGIFIFWASVRFWKYALTKYSSASS